MFLAKFNPYRFVLGSQCMPLSANWELESYIVWRIGYFLFPYLFLLFFAFRRSLWILPFMLSETWINMPSRAGRCDGRPRSFFFVLGWTFCVVGMERFC